jgi:PEP-CTERM motif
MRRSSLILAMITLCCLSTPLYSGVVLWETFNEMTGDYQGQMLVDAFHTINNTNIDIVVNGGLFGNPCQPPESYTCVDMDGTAGYPGNPQGQLQSSMLFPAGNYLLSFNLIGSQRGTTAATTVTFGNYNQTFTLMSNDDTSGIVVNQPVTLDSPGYLMFVSDTPGNIGNYLDNIVVETATPEPSSLILMGSGLLLAVTRFRRR